VMSPTRAAGMKPIITVGAPAATGPPTWGTGPGLIRGQVCMSPMRAAGGMKAFLNRWQNCSKKGAFLTTREEQEKNLGDRAARGKQIARGAGLCYDGRNELSSTLPESP
jgi:hypothetical protein